MTLSTVIDRALDLPVSPVVKLVASILKGRDPNPLKIQFFFARICMRKFTVFSPPDSFSSPRAHKRCDQVKAGVSSEKFSSSVERDTAFDKIEEMFAVRSETFAEEDLHSDLPISNMDFDLNLNGLILTASHINPPLIVSLLVFVLSLGLDTLVNSNSGIPSRLKTITVCDESGKSLQVSFWHRLATGFNGSQGDLIFLEKFRVDSKKFRINSTHGSKVFVVVPYSGLFSSTVTHPDSLPKEFSKRLNILWKWGSRILLSHFSPNIASNQLNRLKLLILSLCYGPCCLMEDKIYDFGIESPHFHGHDGQGNIVIFCLKSHCRSISRLFGNNITVECKKLAGDFFTLVSLLDDSTANPFVNSAFDPKDAVKYPRLEFIADHFLQVPTRFCGIFQISSVVLELYNRDHDGIPPSQVCTICLEKVQGDSNSVLSCRNCGPSALIETGFREIKVRITDRRGRSMGGILSGNLLNNLLIPISAKSMSLYGVSHESFLESFRLTLAYRLKCISSAIILLPDELTECRILDVVNK